MWQHTDETINTLSIDASGRVPWWPQPDVQLFNVMVHVLGDSTRHAGHADILREQLDGSVGEGSSSAQPLHGHDPVYWADRYARIEQAAANAAEHEPRPA